MKVYNKLIGYRKMLNLNQSDIATALGISQSTYSQKEKGVIPFTIDECFIIKDLLKELDLTIDQIFITK